MRILIALKKFKNHIECTLKSVIDDTDFGVDLCDHSLDTTSNPDVLFLEAAAGEASTPVKVPTGSQGNPVTLPSFFPTKEELEAKLLAAKRQPAKVRKNN